MEGRKSYHVCCTSYSDWLLHPLISVLVTASGQFDLSYSMWDVKRRRRKKKRFCSCRSVLRCWDGTASYSKFFFFKLKGNIIVYLPIGSLYCDLSDEYLFRRRVGGWGHSRAKLSYFEKFAIRLITFVRKLFCMYTMHDQLHLKSTGSF